jgi:hypothetical protein
MLPRVRRFLVLVCVVAVCGRTAFAQTATTPFVSASSGPEASARVDATVTRVVDGITVTLPAANVPALANGDRVALRFPDYSGAATRVNYHVNVAFLTEVAPQHWLFERSSAQDRLFVKKTKRAPRASTKNEIAFTYGTGDHRGIPIVLIVPEDGKTRGMDGVRDYVEAHPTDFKNMAESTNDAVDRYTWFADFTAGLSQGAIDPISGQQRVVAVAASLGASQATVAACYVPGATQAEVANCIQGALVSVQAQPNLEAPTQAQFLGGLAGAAAPLQLATYLEPLVAVWQIFARSGRKEYEYLPSSLELARDARHAAAPYEVLAGLKVPTIRPPAAASSALFFTIGDPQSAARPPVVASDTPAGGICATTPRVTIPVHVDRTSKYLNATRLIVATPGKPDRSLPLDPDAAAAPTVDRRALDDGSAAAYTVRLAGRFGFDELQNDARALAHVAVPRDVPWTLAPAPHHEPTAGAGFDMIASAPVAPCLTHAELQFGSAAPLPLQIRRLDAARVELTGSLANVPATDATVRLYQDDPAHGSAIERAVAVAIAPPPAQIDPKTMPTLAQGDDAMELHGTGLDGIAAVRIGTATFAKMTDATATTACFVGAPLANRVQGATVASALLPTNGTPGEAFTTLIGPPRPRGLVALTNGAPVAFSSEPLHVVLTSSTPLPARRELRLRRLDAPAGPCDALRDDDTAVTVPADATHLASATHLDVALASGGLLGDAAFGTLQLQLVDARSGARSDWATIPGTFVRSPAIVRIACPPDAASSCRLFGTRLETIASVDTSAGTVPLGAACAAENKVPCVLVPHLGAYVLRLKDGDTPFPVPQARVGAPAPPSPAPSGG